MLDTVKSVVTIVETNLEEMASLLIQDVVGLVPKTVPVIDREFERHMFGRIFVQERPHDVGQDAQSSA